MKKSYLLIVMIIVIILGVGTWLVLKERNENRDEENIKEGDNKMNDFVSKINIEVNGVKFTATLEDNETARALLKKLPLEIDMTELNGNEKYYYFSDKFPNNPVKPERINAGDLMLYGSDCLVLFYESFNTSYSYTKIGKIDDITSLKEAVGKGNVKVSITE